MIPMQKKNTRIVIGAMIKSDEIHKKSVIVMVSVSSSNSKIKYLIP
jgi:hypothetical protein